MPTQPEPQASAPESSGQLAQPSADAPPSAPGNTAREVTLFHLLVERGWDAAAAYTADQRIHAMTSDTVAASLKPVLEELRQIRETMATKADLAEVRTDLRREMAERETRLVKWMFGAMLAQTAVIVGIVVGVVPLLR